MQAEFMDKGSFRSKRISSGIWILRIAISLIGLTVACNSASPPEADSGSMTQSLEKRSVYHEVPLPAEIRRRGSDPEQIALEVFGLAESSEGNFTQEVMLLDQSSTQAVVTLIQTGLLDDSVEGMRYWLEFVAKENQWELVWAGRQVRCYPDRGAQTWTTDLCS